MAVIRCFAPHDIAPGGKLGINALKALASELGMSVTTWAGLCVKASVCTSDCV